MTLNDLAQKAETLSHELADVCDRHNKSEFQVLSDKLGYLARICTSYANYANQFGFRRKQAVAIAGQIYDLASEVISQLYLAQLGDGSTANKLANDLQDMADAILNKFSERVSVLITLEAELTRDLYVNLAHGNGLFSLTDEIHAKVSMPGLAWSDDSGMNHVITLAS
jgi:deferrochelatase/peroxidase EfeB